MRGFITGCVFFWALIAAVLVPANGIAADSEQRDGQFTMNEVVVTATKTDIRSRETGASITVVTEKEMEQRGKKTVVEALRGTPGVSVSRTGAAGGISSVFMRGVKSNQIMVMVDGVRVNDPSNPDNAFDFAHLTTDNISRIEVVRGAQSTLYGSGATGGVINIITKRGQGEPRIELSVEGGSFRTFRESMRYSGGDEKIDYSFAVSRTDVRGISKAETYPGSTRDYDRDGYKNTTVSSRIGGKVFGTGRLELAARYHDAETDLDDGAYYDDPNSVDRTRQFSSRVGYSQEFFGFWKHTLSADYMSISRRNQDYVDEFETAEFTNSLYEGTHQHAEWQQVLSIGSFDEITAGVEIERDTASSLSYSDMGYGASTTAFGEKSMFTRAAYAQNHLKLFDRIFAVAGVRISDHEEYGSHATYQLSGSILLPFIETRLRGNYATGYRTPSLYQLYGPTYGNEELDPEESTSYDYGIEQSLFDDRFVVDVAYFNTQYKNMIGSDSAYKYINVERYLTDGIEASMKIVPVVFLSITGTYTYTRRAENRDDNDERYIRRPKHQGSFFVNLLLMERLNLNAGLQYVGKRRDGWFNESLGAFGETEYHTMDDYYLLSFAASFQINQNFQIFGRWENDLGEDYQEVAGYRMPGRAFYGGVKGTF